MAAFFNHRNHDPETEEKPDHNGRLFNDSQILYAIVDNIPDFIYIKDRTSKFIFANQKLASTHGLKSGNHMIGKTDHFYYPRELANKFYLNEQEVMKSGKPLIAHEEKGLNEKGEEIYVSTTKIPLKDSAGIVIGVVGIGRDITARKNAEILAHQHKSELEVRGLQLEKANITKDKFFSIIAHDLKNPFHSILGFTDLMIKNWDSIEDSQKREYLELTHESSEHAHNLLENLLQWSRTQTGRINYNPSEIELSSVVDEIYHVLHASIEKKSIRFTNQIRQDRKAMADLNMIQTILRNLIGNAIKFTPEEGSITVSSDTLGDKIIVNVTDTGIGIPECEQKKIMNFSEFYTSPGTEGEQGTGLGLLICLEFIKKHGGDLKFNSRGGKGSTFYFDIPEAG